MEFTNLSLGEFSPFAEYTYAGSSLVSRTDLSNLNKRFYAQDALGSTVAITTTAGAALAKYGYSAYGAPRGATFLDQEERLYTGKVFDYSTGTYNFGFRRYDPFTARFTTVDPIHAGLNWYAYCAGDPINSVDLWGLCPDDEYLKFATIPSMKYNDLNNIPAWAVPLAIIGDLVPLVANTLGVIGNGVVGPANGVAWAAQNPNWSRDVLDYAHDAPIQFVQEQKDYFGSHTAEQVLEEAKNGFIAAVTNPRTLELGIAVCLTYGAGVKVGEYSNAGPGLNGKTFDTAVGTAGSMEKTLFNIEPKIAKQMEKRGWSNDTIDSTINNPSHTVNTSDTRWNADGTKMNDPATAYINKDGSYVVRNDKSGNIVQLSNRNDPDWKSPW